MIIRMYLKKGGRMLSKTRTCRLLGIEGDLVDVEVDISNGMPLFQIVGLADAVIQESKERVKLAIKNSGFEFPLKRIIVNLSPSDIRKEGSSFDLSIAIAILSAMGEVNIENYQTIMIFGELNFSGQVIKSSGCINAMILARKMGVSKVIIPAANIYESGLISGVEIIVVRTLIECVSYLKSGKIPPIKSANLENIKVKVPNDGDFRDIKGQSKAKRALIISAAGGHNVLMMGSPGAGKTLLARSLVTILPEMSRDEQIETTQIYSSVGLIEDDYIDVRPFRSPHHTTSNIALIGGGNKPMAGEISLAHNGILFLDELTEFPKQVLEVLREPLEDREIHISRANYRVKYPANFTLIAASNPCLCGNLYEEGETTRCTCSSGDISKYQRKLSGPLLDRIDLYVEVRRVATDEFFDTSEGESSCEIRKYVKFARNIQNQRFTSGKHNAMMKSSEIKQHCNLNSECQELIKRSMDNLGLTARGVSKVLKISRTIADLDGCMLIEKRHLLEALSFRKTL